MKSSTRLEKDPGVYRITVDERLEESLIRLLVADLKKSKTSISLKDETIWTDERERFIYSREEIVMDSSQEVSESNEYVESNTQYFLSALGIPDEDSSLKKAIKEVAGIELGDIDLHKLWKELQEGQVFLMGRFKVVGPRDKPQALKVDPQSNEFLRIDQIEDVKNTTESLYSKALVGKGKKHDAKNKKK